MELFRNLRLIQQLHDGVTKTFLARDRASRRSVLLHFLPKTDGPERELMLRRLEGLPPNSRHLVLERGEQDETVYVVTESLPDCKSLQDWLDRADALAGPAVTQRPLSPSPPGAPLQGELTRIFQALPVKKSRAETEVPAAGSSAPTPKPGEFTMLFQAPPVPPSSPPQSGPGEFTMFFSSPPLKESPPSPGPELFPTPVSEPPPSPRKPGDFTMIFDRPPMTPEAPSSPASPKPPGVSNHYAVTSEPPRGAVLEHRPSTPGEYSRVIAAAPPEPVPLEPAAALTPPPEPAALPPPQPSYLPLMLVFSFLFLAAFGLILYFIVRR